MKEPLPGMDQGRKDACNMTFDEIKAFFSGGADKAIEFMDKKTKHLSTSHTLGWQAGFYGTMSGILWRIIAAAMKKDAETPTETNKCKTPVL